MHTDQLSFLSGKAALTFDNCLSVPLVLLLQTLVTTYKLQTLIFKALGVSQQPGTPVNQFWKSVEISVAVFMTLWF